MDQTIEQQPKQDIFKQIIDGCIPKTRKEWIWMFIIVIGTIAIGMFILQTYTNLKFQYELLQDPCNLCSALQMNNGSYVGIDWKLFNGTIQVIQQTANISSCSNPQFNLNNIKIK